MGNLYELLDVLYKSTLTPDDFQCIRTEMLNLNVHMSPWQPGKRGPILIFRDDTKETWKKLANTSKHLGDNEMMVVFSLKDASVHTKKLVSLKWHKPWFWSTKSLDLQNPGKNRQCAETILRFLQEQRIRSESRSRSEDIIVGFGPQGCFEDPPLYVSRTERSPPYTDTIPPEEKGFGAESKTGGRPVFVAYDREPDWLMKKAVVFLEDECSIRVERAHDVHAVSPLLVMFKNNTKLQEDIDHAKSHTRTGEDVMLLVVTDRAEQVLVDTPATEGFGAKARLLWDHQRDKFGTKDNRSTLIWLRNFLQHFDYDVNIRLNRRDSLKRSVRSWKNDNASGFYCSVQPIEEELMKNTIVYFDRKLIVMKMAPEPTRESSDRFILFCSAGLHAENAIEELLKRRKYPRDVLIVMLCRSYHQTPPKDKFLPATMLQLLVSDMQQEILDIAENNNVVKSVRSFLKKSSRRDVNKTPAYSQQNKVENIDKDNGMPAEESKHNDSSGLTLQEYDSIAAEFSQASPSRCNDTRQRSLAGEYLQFVPDTSNDRQIVTKSGTHGDDSSLNWHPKAPPNFGTTVGATAKEVLSGEYPQLVPSSPTGQQHIYADRHDKVLFSSHRTQQGMYETGVHHSVPSNSDAPHDVFLGGPHQFASTSQLQRHPEQEKYPSGYRDTGALSFQSAKTRSSHDDMVTGDRTWTCTQNRPYTGIQERPRTKSREMSWTGHVVAQETMSELYPMHGQSDSQSMQVSMDAYSANRRQNRGRSLPGKRRGKQQPSRVTILPNKEGQSVFTSVQSAVGVPIETEPRARHKGVKRNADEALNELMSQLGEMAIREDKKPHVENTKAAAPRNRRRRQQRSRR